MSDAVRLVKQNRTCGSASRKSKQNWSLQLGKTLFAENKCFCECVCPHLDDTDQFILSGQNFGETAARRSFCQLRLMF